MKPEEKIWEEWDVIEDALGGDVLKLERALAGRDSPTLRRAYVRAVFAYSEGIAGWMKRYVVLLYHPGMLGDDEKVELERRDGALQSLVKALDLFTNVAGAPTPLKKGSREWIVIRSAILIRNRITHPAKASDVVVSDADLFALTAAHNVITDLIGRSLVRSATMLARKAKKFRAARATLNPRESAAPTK